MRLEQLKGTYTNLGIIGLWSLELHPKLFYFHNSQRRNGTDQDLH